MFIEEKDKRQRACESLESFDTKNRICSHGSSSSSSLSVLKSAEQLLAINQAEEHKVKVLPWRSIFLRVLREGPLQR